MNTITLRANAILPALALASLLVACGGNSLPDNERLVEVFNEGQTGVWISGHGTVTQLPPDDATPSPAQRIVVRINDNFTVVLRHALDHSERVPAEKGDTVAFQGRYEWDARGGLVSFTYADEDQPGGGGWIELEGTRYE